LAPLVKAIGFILASSHVCGFVWRTARQINRHYQNHSTFEVLHCFAGQLLRRAASNWFVDQPPDIHHRTCQDVI
jgi:hypothetical protein